MSCFNGQEAPADGEGVDLMELPAQDEQNTITRLTRPSRKAAKKARKTAVKKKARTEEIMVSEDSADDDWGGRPAQGPLSAKKRTRGNDVDSESEEDDDGAVAPPSEKKKLRGDGPVAALVRHTALRSLLGA